MYQDIQLDLLAVGGSPSLSKVQHPDDCLTSGTSLHNQTQKLAPSKNRAFLDVRLSIVIKEATVYPRLGCFQRVPQAMCSLDADPRLG